MAAASTHKEGFLLKKAVRTLLKENWKKRWVVVDEATATLTYAKAAGKAPILSIPITDKSAVVATTEHKKPHEFKLVTDSYTFYACAESDADLKSWIQSVEAVIASKKVPSPPPPPGAKPVLPTAPPRSPDNLSSPSLPSSSTGKPSGGAGATHQPPMGAAEYNAKADVAILPKPSVPAGVGTTVAVAPPPPVTPPAPVTAAKPMSMADLVRKTEDRLGQLLSIGANDVGQLGVGNINTSGAANGEYITALKGKNQPISVSCGYRFAAAVSASHQLFVWGDNTSQQLGATGVTRSLRPHMVSVLRSKQVLAVACGGSHALAIVSEHGTASGAVTLGPLPPGSGVHSGHLGGALYVWGSSAVGALGLGPDIHIADQPTLVHMPGVVSNVYGGMVTSAAIVSGRDLFVWGDASFGRLGLGDAGKSVAAVPIWQPTPLPLCNEEGIALIPQTVGLGATFSAFLGRQASSPPGAACQLLVAGAIGADAAVIQSPSGDPDCILEGAPVTVFVRRPLDASGVPIDISPLNFVPKETTTFKGKFCCVGLAAGIAHYAVIAREMADDSKKMSLLAAAKATSAPSPSAQPVRMRGLVYTAGYGILGHDTGALSFEPYLCCDPKPVAGALADEDVLEVAAGHMTTYARNLWGELFAWGVNEYGNLFTGKYVDLPLPTTCKEMDGAHFEQIAAGPDFVLALQYPGLLGDAQARKLAQNAFSKWRKKAGARAAAKSTDDKQLTAMLMDIAADAGLGEEMQALGMDLKGILGALLRTNADAHIQAEAEAAAAPSAGIAGLAGALSDVPSRKSVRAVSRASIYSGLTL